MTDAAEPWDPLDAAFAPFREANAQLAKRVSEAFSVTNSDVFAKLAAQLATAFKPPTISIGADVNGLLEDFAKAIRIDVKPMTAGWAHTLITSGALNAVVDQNRAAIDQILDALKPGPIEWAQLEAFATAAATPTQNESTGADVPPLPAGFTPTDLMRLGVYLLVIGFAIAAGTPPAHLHHYQALINTLFTAGPVVYAVGRWYWKSNQ